MSTACFKQTTAPSQQESTPKPWQAQLVVSAPRLLLPVRMTPTMQTSQRQKLLRMTHSAQTSHKRKLLPRASRLLSLPRQASQLLEPPQALPPSSLLLPQALSPSSLLLTMCPVLSFQLAQGWMETRRYRQTRESALRSGSFLSQKTLTGCFAAASGRSLGNLSNSMHMVAKQGVPCLA